MKIWIRTLATCLLTLETQAHAWSISRGQLVEDFTDVSHWDTTSSTGLWNIVDHAAQIAAYSNGDPTRPISFGDGSDGIVTSSTGYTFNTNLKPNGYNFVYLNISGGTVSVVGSNPLIIRSLSTVNITPILSVKGGDGITGLLNISSGQAGGSAVAGLCAGGAGGSAVSAPAGSGGHGYQYDGTPDTTDNPGTGGGTTGTPGSNATFTGNFPSTPSSWDSTANSFICGSGGPGGGGQFSNATHFSTGGSGGGGGGVIHLNSVGNISYSIIDISGGAPGNGTASTTFCSGTGTGGNGGSLWIQTLHLVSGTSINVLANTISPCNGSLTTPVNGFYRVDAASGVTSGDDSGAHTPGTGMVTSTVPAITSKVASLSYDLGTQNAAFFSPPTVATTLNGGSISIQYAGSKDNVTFSSLTSDITTLSNLNYRYVKFVAKITSPGALTSPQINSVTVPFSELNVQLSGGCGTTQSPRRGSGNSDSPIGIISLLFWASLWAMGHRRLVPKSS